MPTTENDKNIFFEQFGFFREVHKGASENKNKQ